MVKSRVREVTIREESGVFKMFGGEKKVNKEVYDFDGVNSLRKLLSKEKARMIDCIKYKKPTSIYDLSKILNRPFKAVMDDIKILERFGIIELISEKVNKRTRHKPIVVIDSLTVHFKI